MKCEDTQDPALIITGIFGLLAALMLRRSQRPASVILFDINETLLDTHALDPYFARVFGSTAARERWFKELEGLMLTTIATGAYQDFPRFHRRPCR